MVQRRRIVLQPKLGDGKDEILAAAPAGTSAARVRPRTAKALALPGLTLLLIATVPQANGSRAKRRNPASHVSVEGSSAISGLARTQSSIPGVSIWTSKGTASRLQPRRGAAAPATAFAPSTVDSDAEALSDETSASRLREETELNSGSAKARRVRRRRSCQSSDAQNLLKVDCQVSVRGRPPRTFVPILLLSSLRIRCVCRTISALDDKMLMECRTLSRVVNVLGS